MIVSMTKIVRRFLIGLVINRLEAFLQRVVARPFRSMLVGVLKDDLAIKSQIIPPRQIYEDKDVERIPASIERGVFEDSRGGGTAASVDGISSSISGRIRGSGLGQTRQAARRDGEATCRRCPADKSDHCSTIRDVCRQRQSIVRIPSQDRVSSRLQLTTDTYGCLFPSDDHSKLVDTISRELFT